MQYNGYAIKVTLGRSTDNAGANLDNIHESKLFVPRVSYPKNYIAQEIPGEPSFESISDTAQALGILDGGCPYFNPGLYSYAITDLTTVPGYSDMYPFLYYHESFSATLSSGFNAIVTYDGEHYNGIFAHPRGQIYIVYQGYILYFRDSGGSMAPGLGYGYDNLSLSGFFITSDNFVGYYTFVRHVTGSGSAIVFLDALSSASFIEWLEGQENLANSDPFSDFGDNISTPGGGGGSFDSTSDPIPTPSLPSVSAANTGFITTYNPTRSQLVALANYMWTDSLFDPDSFRKIVANPADVLLSFMILPVPITNGGDREFLVGNISTGIRMNVAASQYVQFDCGTINVEEFWGAYLDYSPYTKAELYLPFIGAVQINIDEIMARSVNITYNVDILTGACVAFIKAGDKVLYSFPGNCAIQIPFTGDSYTEMIKSIVNLAGTAITAGAGIKASTIMANSAVKQNIADVSELAAFGKEGQALSDLGSNLEGVLKPSILRSGTISGSAGLLGIRYPYLILTRPNLCLPARQYHYIGYPSFTTVLLGSLSGYTVIESVHLEGMTCTEAELAQIENLLKSGVIF